MAELGTALNGCASRMLIALLMFPSAWVALRLVGAGHLRIKSAPLSAY
jgi:hypothetical protein